MRTETREERAEGGKSGRSGFWLEIEESKTLSLR